MSHERIPLPGLTVALVGGAGFIGHNLALKLKSLGADVHVIDGLAVNNFYALQKDRASNPNSDLYLAFVRQRLKLLHRAQVPFVELDARDYHGLTEAMKEIKPDVVVQLAAVAHANRSNKDPYSTFDHSLRTLENALDVSRSEDLGVKHFIYFSSSMVYGNFSAAAVTEDAPCEPLGIYGALKFAGEKLVIAYNQVFDLPYTIIRPSALYGARCVSRRVGQALIENAIQGKPLTVNGDGSDKLDFTYIDDLTQGVVNAIMYPGARNEIFNLTYGSARSIGQMVAIIGEHFPGVDIRHNPRDSLMPERGTLNVDKARRLIAYDPQFPLEKGLVDYIDWYKSNWEELSRDLSAADVVYLKYGAHG